MSTRTSVAMATFNGSRYLREQLESIAAQSRLPDELVVVDDLSGDTTLEVLEDFTRSCPFDVKIHQNPSRRGLDASFETALREATGDVVFLCDQDDVWRREKVRRVCEVFDQHPDAFLVQHDSRLVDARRQDLGVTIHEQSRRKGLQPQWVPHGHTLVLRRELIELILPFPVLSGEHHLPPTQRPPFFDIWLNLAAVVLSGKVVIDEVLQEWRRHDLTATTMLARLEQYPTSRRVALRRRIGMDPRPGLKRLVEMNDALAERFGERIDERGSDARSFDSARRYAQSYRNHAQTRLDVLETRGLMRVRSVLKGVGAGVYSDHSGMRGVLRDLLFSDGNSDGRSARRTAA